MLLPRLLKLCNLKIISWLLTANTIRYTSYSKSIYIYIYKAGKPSVCLIITSISQACLHRSERDLLKMTSEPCLSFVKVNTCDCSSTAVRKRHGRKLIQPLNAKGFCSAGSVTDCYTEKPGFESNKRKFFSVYKLFVLLIEQSETL